MASQYPILNIEAAPGDPPRAVGQLNGDLLVPAAARPLIAQALLLAQEVLSPERTDEWGRIEQVCRLLGVVRIDIAHQTLLANLGKIRPV